MRWRGGKKARQEGLTKRIQAASLVSVRVGEEEEEIVWPSQKIKRKNI